MRSKASVFAAIVSIFVLALAGMAFADGLIGDADADSLSPPANNGRDATQDVGTSHGYDFSASVTDTGNPNDTSHNVFQASTDTVTGSVAITQNDHSWPASLSVNSLTFTTYGQNMAGVVNITVPTGTVDGTLNHIKVTITGTASNGQTLSPASVELNYNITAHAPSCTPAFTVDFLPPFDDSSPQGLIVNTMKSGRTVPVKITILDLCTGDYVTDGVVTIAVSKSNDATGTNTDAVETYADAGASNGNTNIFRWSPDASIPATQGGGFWIYNLDSRNALNGSPLVVNTVYRINAYLGTQLVTGSDWALLKPVK